MSTITPSPLTPPQPFSPPPAPNVTAPEKPAQKPSGDSVALPENKTSDKLPSTDNAQSATGGGLYAEARKKLERIAELLTRRNLAPMMSEPYSKQNQLTLNELRTLLSEDSINSLSSDSKELAEMRSKIGGALSDRTIRGLQRETALGPNFGQVAYDSTNLDPHVPWSRLQAMQSEQRKEDIKVRQRILMSDPLAKKLIDIGGPFQPPKTDAKPADTPVEPDKKPSENATQPEQSVLEKPSPRIAPLAQAPNTPSTTEEVKTEPTTPRADEAHRKLKQIDELMSRDSLIEMLREPGSQESIQRVEKIKALMSEDSLNILSQDMRDELIDRVRLVLSKENLQTLSNENGIAQAPLPPADEHQEHEAKNDTTSEHATVEPANTPWQNGLPPGIPRTFSYNDINEAPNDVTGFTSGTDKIDLAGTRHQLGDQPTQLVERFTGASGEMTINYYANTHTSVVTISRNPGQPPFELKVSGEVRYSDITR